MKKQLLLTFSIAVLTGTTLGCSQNKNANQPTAQEVKKELSNEEIVKTALNNFSKEKNLELDTKVNIKSNFMAEGYSVNVLSNIKIDDSGNVLKKFSEQETELGKNITVFFYKALAKASINLSIFSKSSSVSASISILRFPVGLVAPVFAICSSNWSTQTQYSS